METTELDDLDRRILYMLQADARNNTATAIAEEVGVTANTVRNRIEQLEDDGIIAGYGAHVRYEEADYQLRVSMKCTAPVPERTEIASRALDVDGVVAVRELMTGRSNVEVTVVAAASSEVTEAATRIHEIGLEIEAEELVKNDHVRPFDGFARDGSPE